VPLLKVLNLLINEIIELLNGRTGHHHLLLPDDNLLHRVLGCVLGLRVLPLDDDVLGEHDVDALGGGVSGGRGSAQVDPVDGGTHVDALGQQAPLN
jgi:hypothetical protein